MTSERKRHVLQIRASNGVVNGHPLDKAHTAMKNAELLKYFRQLEELPDADLQMFVKLIAAYLRDHKAKQAYS